jgi:hypothetical protein
LNGQKTYWAVPDLISLLNDSSVSQPPLAQKVITDSSGESRTPADFHDVSGDGKWILSGATKGVSLENVESTQIHFRLIAHMLSQSNWHLTDKLIS